MTDATAEEAAMSRALGLERGAATEAELSAQAAVSLALWQRDLAALDRALPERPPEALRGAVLARIASVAQDEATAPVADTYTQHAADAAFVEVAPGVRLRQMFASHERTISLVVMEPGAVYDPHPHARDEECYVISGDLSFGPLHLASGDFHLARRGSTHQRATTRSGCTLYIAS